MAASYMVFLHPVCVGKLTLHFCGDEREGVGVTLRDVFVFVGL